MVCSFGACCALAANVSARAPAATNVVTIERLMQPPRWPRLYTNAVRSPRMFFAAQPSGGLMTLDKGSSSAVSNQSADLRLHGVRYQVADVNRAVAFYTTHLGFKLEHQQLPAFAMVSLGD